MRTLTPKSVTGGPAESGYYPALVENARVINVNIRDWTVDCMSEHGGRRFFDIQVMSPYLHYANGEGMYAMPEVGALCWICTPSPGAMAQPFVLGWQAPVDSRPNPETGVPDANFKANRSNLNPGDMMMKTRDENFIILRRGGVVQIGATPIAQRFYFPIRNLIRDVCENYKLESLAGDMDWSVQRTDQDEDGNQLCHFELKSKLKAGEPSHAVILRTGSHEADDTLRLTLLVRPDGEEGSPSVAQLSIDNEGTVTWDVEKDWNQGVLGNVTLTSEEGDMLLEAASGSLTLTASGGISLSSGSNVDVEAAEAVEVVAPSVTVTSDTINLKGNTQIGGPGGEALVKGQALADLLLSILTKLVSGDAGISMRIGMPQTFPGLSSEIPKIQAILSNSHTTT